MEDFYTRFYLAAQIHREKRHLPQWAVIIPQEILDQAAQGKRRLGIVHVMGWPKACQFRYQRTVKGVHQLRTPKTGKLYTTTLPLYYKRGEHK
ncbi:hypothetical protein GC174_14815 [bacterium]|nr:hypothetical protein [bacterium]